MRSSPSSPRVAGEYPPALPCLRPPSPACARPFERLFCVSSHGPLVCAMPLRYRHACLLVLPHLIDILQEQRSSPEQVTGASQLLQTRLLRARTMQVH